ncbi:MAG: hypothetical protein P8N45_05245, partial [Glaciecola sp.]|nr:hypothetical protein [Glaciecola sp.]
GNSSAGRAQPCQGWGREFESRFPLQTLKNVAFHRKSAFFAFKSQITYTNPLYLTKETLKIRAVKSTSVNNNNVTLLHL